MIFYAPPPLEGKIATDTLTPSSAPAVYEISGLTGGGLEYVTGAEAENAAANFSEESVPLGGFKKALLLNPPETIRGRIFGFGFRPKVRVAGQKSEGYRPKVRVTAGQTPRIRTKSPRKGTRMGFGCFHTQTPFKAFLNPPKVPPKNV